MGVLSTSVGTIYKKINEYYDCRIRDSIGNWDDSIFEWSYIVREIFYSKYPIESMPTPRDLYINACNRIELTTGFRTKLVRTNIDLIEVFDVNNRSSGYFFILQRHVRP